ncbi:MAG: hypothetical protein AB7O52_15205 [Planctomycetota bacterium]
MAKWCCWMLLGGVMLSGCRGTPDSVSGAPIEAEPPAERARTPDSAPARHPSPVLAELVDRFSVAEPSGDSFVEPLRLLGNALFERLLAGDSEGVAKCLLTPAEIDEHYRPAFASMLKMEGRAGFDRAWHEFLAAADGRNLRLLEVVVGEVARPGPADGVHSMLTRPVEFVTAVQVRCAVGERFGVATLRNLLRINGDWRALRFEFDLQE